MAITHATWATARRASFGTLHYKQLYNTTWAYTETQKIVAAGTTTAVISAQTIATAGSTVSSGFTDPDVPRALSITVGGTATSIQACSVTVNGTNVEGKAISESFKVTIATAATINGTKAFKTVTSLVVPAQVGSGVTVAVGTRNLLGVNHRLEYNQTTVKVWSGTTAYGALTLQAAPTIVANDTLLENNTVSPATTPNGTTFLIIGYCYDNFQGDGSSINDQPEYSTTTSTSSTSSSTSVTTITTSTSSTSTSVSTSSTSTSSTSSSTSTSSTSTSTTTTP